MASTKTMRAIDRLRKAANLQATRKEVTLSDGTVFETYAPEGLESAFSDASYLAKHFQQRAYHGTPHRFEKFSTGAIGTGEGVQAYGWGLYFASQWEVANFYRETLSGSADASQFGFEYDGVVLTPSELVEELWGQFEMEVVYDTQEFGKLKQEIMKNILKA